MRRTTFWATIPTVLVAMLVTGCLQGADVPLNEAPRPQAPRVRLAPPEGLQFTAPVVVGAGVEPNVAVGPDGTLYVTAVGPLSFWRSRDGGASFEHIADAVCPRSLPQCGPLESRRARVQGPGDADLTVTPDGTLHWLGLSAADGEIPYQRSTDQGESWSDVLDLADRGVMGDREWITHRADGTLFAAWRNNGQGQDKIVVRQSHDGGQTWQKAVPIADNTRQGGIAVDAASNALALAHDLAGVVSVARSLDNGTTWDSVVVVDHRTLGHVFPVLAFDAAGTLYLAYSHDADGAVPEAAGSGLDTQGRPFEHPNVYLHASHDKGATWGPAVQVNPAGTTAWFPWIAAGSAGRVAVVWYQNDEGYPRQVGGDVYVMMGVSLDADFPDPRFAVDRLSPQAVHRGPECRETPVVCTRPLADFFEVAIDNDGAAVAVWTQDTWPVPSGEVGFARLVGGPDLTAD